MRLHICRVTLEPSSVYKNHKLYVYWLYDFFISLHLFYFWWPNAHKPSVTLQFMALPYIWRFNSWFDRQIRHSCGVWQWQVLFFYCDCLTSGKFCISKHSCSYIIIVPWNNIQKPLLLSIFFYAEKALASLCKFAQAHLSLRPGTEISCAGSNNYLCTVYKNSECCGEAAPATMTHLGNHQCVASMRQKCSQCVVIKFLNKTLASLPSKKDTKW